MNYSNLTWSVIPLFERLEFHQGLSPRGQTVAKLLYYDTQKIRKEMEKRGGYWKPLLRDARGSEDRFKDEIEFLQRHLERVTTTMEILYRELKVSKSEELKTTILPKVKQGWNQIMEALMEQFPAFKDEAKKGLQVYLRKLGGIYGISVKLNSL